MVFSLFKRKEYADTIIYNGKIKSLNSEEGEVRAIALKDKKIFALGDDEIILEELKDEDTLLIDLEGRSLMPGRIKNSSETVLSAFNDLYLKLSPEDSLDSLLKKVEEELKRKDNLFGYGYEESLFKDMSQEEVRELLDKVSNGKPVALMAWGGFHVIINTSAREIVRAAAEEEGVMQITVPYLVNTLGLIDYDKLVKNVLALSFSYSKEGICSIMDAGAPDYFATLYHEVLAGLYQEKMIKQRFYGSLYIDRDLEAKSLVQKLMHQRTLCNEMEGLINFNSLHLHMKEKPVGKDNENLAFSIGNVEDLIMAVAERDFDIIAEVESEGSLRAAMLAMDKALGAGFRKSKYIISAKIDISEELEDKLREEIISFDEISFDEGYLEETMGIEEAGPADFVVFEENVENLRREVVYMTILDGEVVYEKATDSPEKWYQEYMDLQATYEEEFLGEEEHLGE